MKIYVVASRSGKKGLKAISRISRAIENSGYEVNRSLIERSFQDEHQDLVSNYKEHMKSIRDADILICEVTAYSPGVGFIIATALQQGKAVLALHDKKSKIVPSNLLRGIESKAFQFEEYSSLSSVEGTVLGAIKILSKGLDKRFILTIQPDIDKYLDWASREKGKNKADVVRDAVRKTIIKDRDYIP